MDYRDIGHMYRGVFDAGKLKIQSEGFYFKSSRTGKTFQVPESELDSLEWMRVARGYEVKVFTKDGNVTKFEGFKESDYADLKNYFRSSFKKDLQEVDLSVKGWNWGEAKFRGSLMSFIVDNKPAFEIPLKEVSQVTSSKNEVILEFHQSEEAPLSLVEMRFHIPNVTPHVGEEGVEIEDDEQTNPVKLFHSKVLAKADVIQATGDAIVTFAEIHTLTPRGRYSIKAYPTFLQLHGKTFDYKIPFNTVTRLFLLPHNDQRQMFFVIGLDPPIRQGQTRYHFIIFLLPTDEDCDVTLALTEEELQERYEGKIAQNMSGTFYEVFSRVMRVLVGRKITVPGTFKSNNNNHCAIACSCRATSGYLYPLDKGFIFVHKPALYIKFDEIASVNFARMTGGAGVSRSFDFEVELKDGNTHHFSSLMKEDYTRLFEFVSEKNLRVKNTGKAPVQTVSYNDDASSESGHDAYLERMKAEGEERDSEDEDSDFVAGASGSEDDLEYDSDAHISGSDDEEEGGGDDSPEQRATKRKKVTSKATNPPKRRKQDTGGKKQRAKKDPNAPKKPLSAYMLWLQENRASFKEKYPGITVTEIGKKAGEMWKQISKEEKQEFEGKAVRAKKRYEKEIAEYKASGAAAAFASASSKSPTKSKKAAPKRSPVKQQASSSKSSDSKKYKSAEFVPSDVDSSSDEDSGTDKTPAKRKRGTRSKGGDEGLVSLPSGGEEDNDSEGEAELTSGSEEESESD